MCITVWGATDKGREREGNEDAVYPHSGAGTFAWQPGPERLAQRGQLLIVADGVGGARAGREASHWAIRVAAERYYDLSSADLGNDLCIAVEAANASLYRYLQEVGAPEAGSTMAAAVIYGDMLYVVNAGDSRAYLVRDGQITQLTRDHTLTQRKIDQGLIRPEQAEMDPDRSVLTRSLGVGPTVQVDLFPSLQLISGDVVLLCSDGLTDMLADAEIARLVGGNAPKWTAQRLIAAANERGGFDNISVVVARVGGERQTPAADGEASIRRFLLAGLVLLATCFLCTTLVGLGGILYYDRRYSTPAPFSVSSTMEITIVAPTPTVVVATPTQQPTSTPAPTLTRTPTLVPGKDDNG